MLEHLIKVTLRNLWKYRGYTAINIAGLALGMAFSALIFLWVLNEIGFDRFHADLDRLHMVAFTNESRDFFGDSTVGALAGYLEETYQEVEAATRVSYPETWKLRHDGGTYYGRLLLVDPAFFDMFSFPAVAGDPVMALTEPNSMVMTEDLANRIFGDQDPIGETIEGLQGIDYTVAAVVQELPRNTAFRAHCFIPVEYGPAVYGQWDVKCLKTFVRLKAGANHVEVSQKIRNAYNIHNNQDTRNDQYLVPLADVHLYSLDGHGGTIVFVGMFAMIGGAVLLLACINFVNLSTARSEIRFREIGVKKAIGARRLQLVRQFLAESVVLSCISMLLAVLLLEWMIPVVNAVLGLRLDLSLTGNTVSMLVAVTLAAGLFSGIYPAFYLSSLKPAAVLGRHIQGGAGKSGITLRRCLVIMQFTVTVVFVLSVVTIFTQLQHLRTMDMGFEKNNVVLFNLPGELQDRAQVVKQELLNHRNIESITVSTSSLLKWHTSFGIDWEGKTPEQVFDVGYNEVDHDYLETFGMEMVAGRFFSKDYPSDKDGAYVVNEAAVTAMGVDDPVGRRIVIARGSSWEKAGTIIGVIRNYHTETAHKEIRPFMLGLSERGYLMCARLGGGNVSETIQDIRKKIRDVVPDAGVYCRFFNDELMGAYRVEVMTGGVIVFMALIAIVISCLGLLGLTAYTARRRTREIGIRKVLGASAGSILGMFVRETVVLVLAAGVIGSAVSYYIMGRWLENFAYRVEFDVAVSAFATVSLVIVALAAVGGQALRAAAANPADAIRQE